MENLEKIQTAARIIRENPGKGMAFTGAGISVESGIPPFRGADGLWSKVDPSFIEIDTFRRAPEECWSKIRELFYDHWGQAKPNAAHIRLAEMLNRGLLAGIVTQNIDCLHQRAGAPEEKISEFHGTLDSLTAVIGHLEALINTSAILGVNMVTTFIGRDQHKTVEENIELFKKIWPPIIRLAEEKGVKVAIENCPMLFGPDQWPGGQNLMYTPAIFRRLFAELPSSNFGLNFDPSHYVWQGLDYVQTVYEFKDKLFHIHFKDIKLYQDKLRQVGVLAYPLEYMSPKLPGLGDVDWGAFVSALNDIRYNGDAVIEVEDKAFESCKEDVLKSIRLSKRYLDNFII